MRERNSCLAALEIMRRASAGIRLGEALGFLYVCENEGINIRELSQLLNVPQPTASRIAARLATGNAHEPISMALIVVSREQNDGRGRLLHLSDAGRALRHQIDLTIKAAHPIALNS